jgi:hypothetical protein
MKSTCVLVLLLVLIASPSFAETERNKTVGGVGAQQNISYVWFEEDLNLNCRYNIVYIENDSNFGKMAYSTLLTAKSANKKIVRIDYYQKDDLTCHCTLVSMGD